MSYCVVLSGVMLSCVRADASDGSLVIRLSVQFDVWVTTAASRGAALNKPRHISLWCFTAWCRNPRWPCMVKSDVFRDRHGRGMIDKRMQLYFSSTAHDSRGSYRRTVRADFRNAVSESMHYSLAKPIEVRIERVPGDIVPLKGLITQDPSSFVCFTRLNTQTEAYTFSVDQDA